VPVLFQKRFWPLIADGSVTVTFRRWHQRQAVPGGRYRTPSGFIDVTAVEVIEAGGVSDADAVRAGYATADELLADLPDKPSVPLYRIDFRFAGTEDPRADLAAEAGLTEDDLSSIDARLARFDAAAKAGPWTRTTLDLIATRPGVRAADLAASIGRETPEFKRDVRKLKELGLTLSLEVGYELSPRGRAYLAGASS
jgi:hypothetical protein